MLLIAVTIYAVIPRDLERGPHVFGPAGSHEGILYPLAIATFLAAVLLMLEGLRTARRAALGRRLSLTAAIASPMLFAASGRLGQLLPALFFSAGCALAIGWLRRADRRDRALALLAFAWLGISRGNIGLAAIGLLTLTVFTAPPARAATARLALITLAGSVVGALAFSSWVSPKLRGVDEIAIHGREFALSLVQPSGWPVVVVGFALAVFAFVSRARRPDGGRGSQREILALVTATVLVFTERLLTVRPGSDGASAGELLPVVFSATLFASVVLAPRVRGAS